MPEPMPADKSANFVLRVFSYINAYDHSFLYSGAQRTFSYLQPFNTHGDFSRHLIRCSKIKKIAAAVGNMNSSHIGFCNLDDLVHRNSEYFFDLQGLAYYSSKLVKY